MRKKTLLIGAGQIGSRHLQGLLKSRVLMEIVVVDPSQQSIETAKTRSAEIVHDHELHFWNDLQDNFSSWDLVIVATGAGIREKVIVQLLEKYKVQYLVLEKVMFQETMAYARVKSLLEAYGVKTWVNHPRRMFQSYKRISELVKKDDQLVFEVMGSDWGLACNTLHFIDIFCYLTGSLPENIDTDWIEEKILQSKRHGYIELTGTIKGKLSNGSRFVITSLDATATPVTITIMGADYRLLIQEGGTPFVQLLAAEKAFAPESFPFAVEYQSCLSAQLANDIFEKNDCELPSYEEAAFTHEMFINALLRRYNRINGSEAEILPIT